VGTPKENQLLLEAFREISAQLQSERKVVISNRDTQE